MQALQKILLLLVVAGTLAGCVVYDGPYPYRPYPRYYHFHDRDDCWHCDRW